MCRSTNRQVYRNPLDYAALLGMIGIFAYLGSLRGGWSTEEDTESIQNNFLLLGRVVLGDVVFERQTVVMQWAASFTVYWFIAAFFLTSMCFASLSVFRWWDPTKVPNTHIVEISKSILPNTLFLLPTYQVVIDFLACNGMLRSSSERLDDFTTIAVDSLLWMLGFEISWYLQHRLMHDVKPLWTYGHELHHTWRKPEHMIGITNFSFDHLVEPWVTMSSSLLPSLLFPCNFYLAKITSFMYMFLALLVHWDGFPYRYHLNHHYQVLYNYGSHWPIFDIMFGTYYWEPKDKKVC
eukprot:TRINITY_DN34851_c0_g1_i1.p1 TRINITY_DN34851_c0_g1~~TRINITY_DN34851_c0_g1_i1.p1  ORF type:complete len:312 (+),score=20.27 TRINITY_DN34851_c0_g1_i1:56-937(+)